MAKKKIYGSLISRIIGILFFFIIVPLLLYLGVIWHRDWQIRMGALFSKLELIGLSNGKIFDNWASSSKEELSRIQERSFIEGSIERDSFFVVAEDRFASATQKEMVGQPIFFPKKLDKAFLAYNPFTKQDEIFVLQESQGQIVGQSIGADKWVKTFAFFDKSQFPARIFFSEKLPLQEENSYAFSLLELRNWKKTLDFSHQYALNEKRLILSVPLPQAHFILQIQVPALEVAKQEGTFLFHFLLIVVCISLLGIWGTLWLIKQVAKPLHQLNQVITDVGHQKYEQRYRRASLGFEINAVGEHFNEMITSLLKNMEAATIERGHREALLQELRIGRQVQKQLFPKKIPKIPQLLVGAGFAPAKEVGGDFYDLFPVQQNGVFIAIADVSDKGVSACLYSLIIRSLLRSYAMSKKSLEEIISLSNHLFCLDTADSGNFVTLWSGFYHTQTKLLTYHCSGHLPAVLLHPEGTIEELTTEGVALGVQELGNVSILQKYLPEGSLLFLYTDGVIEAQNKKGDHFGKDRLFEFLKTSRNLTPQQLVDHLMVELNQFAKDLPQYDDMTVLCLKTITDHS